MINEQDFSLLR